MDISTSKYRKSGLSVERSDVYKRRLLLSMEAERLYRAESLTLPVRWEAALDAFSAGTVLPKYLGKTYHETFEKCRREECDRFRSEVSERDFAWYLRAV